MFVYGLIHMCECMRKPEADIRNIPVTLPLFLRQDLSKLNLELEDSVILASESQGSHLDTACHQEATPTGN